MKDNILQDVHAFEECKFNTASGKLISIYDPKPEDICIEDIAASLSKICRFGGNIGEFYSVAQHSVMVSFLAPDELKKAALLHDAAEAYLGDVIKPLKHILEPLYTPIEQRFEKVIFEKFNVPIDHLEKIKPYDMQALTYEHEYFRGINRRHLIDFWHNYLPWLDVCLNHSRSRHMFSDRYDKIFYS